VQPQNILSVSDRVGPRNKAEKGTDHQKKRKGGRGAPFLAKSEGGWLVERVNGWGEGI